MSNILEMLDFTLKIGVSETEFLLAHEKFNHEFMSNQKGYVSHQLVKRGEQWFDIAVWDSIESKEKAFSDIYQYEGLSEYMSFIEQEGTDDDIPIYTVVRTY